MPRSGFGRAIPCLTWAAEPACVFPGSRTTLAPPAEHHRLEEVYGALRATLTDHRLSPEQRAPYTEAAARVVTRQLEFTGAALAPLSE